MNDRLESLLAHFAVTAQVFHAGALCGISALGEESGTGQLHLVREGEVVVVNAGQEAARVHEPSLLLYPRPLAHHFVTDARRGADFACAHLRFEGGAGHPIVQALPAFVCLPLRAVEGAAPLLELLFDEAFAQRCGRQALLDRLFEAVLILILRQLMESRHVQSGLLAGLADPRLRHALIAMHAQPQHGWTLEALAQRAGMARSVFATRFRATVGRTPGDYLQHWRVALAQKALRAGRALKLIADEVGYGSEAALSRAFKAQCGLSPREWRRSVLRSAEAG